MASQDPSEFKPDMNFPIDYESFQNMFQSLINIDA